MKKQHRSLKLNGPSTWRRKALAAAVSVACVSIVLIHDISTNVAHADSCPATNNTIAGVTNSACSLGDVTGTDTLTVNNGGLISVTTDSAAVFVNNPATGVTITNNGTIALSITGTDSGSAAILLDSAVTGTTIVNTGSITAFESFTAIAEIAGVMYENDLDGTLTNDGTISAAVTFASGAIAVGVDIDEITGTLTNSSTGTISATANAVVAAAAMGVLVGTANVIGPTVISGDDIAAGGALTNNGNINAAASSAFIAVAGGIVLGDLFGDLTNGGSISASANFANLAVAAGVLLVDTVLTGGGITGADIAAFGTLTNTGSITATASSANSVYAVGIGASRIVTNGDLVNSGDISAMAHFASFAVAAGVSLIDTTTSIALGGEFTNTTTGTISATASSASQAIAQGVLLEADLAGTLTNDGSISANAHFANNALAAGIILGTSVMSTADITGTLTNSSSGQISASVSSVNDGSAFGLLANNLSGTFTNDGSISATFQNIGTMTSGPADSVIGVGFRGTVSNTLTNSGMIHAQASVTDINFIAGLYVDTVTGTVDNTGVISAALTADTANTVTVYGFRVNTAFNGTLNNSGLISAALTGGDPASRSYALNFATGTGFVSNQTGGVLSAQAFFLGGTIGLTNNGTITISQLSNVGDDYIQNSGSTLNIIVNSTTNNDSGRINVGANMNISAGSTIFMNTGSVLNITSSTYTVLDATTSTTDVEAMPPVIAGSALYSFAVDATSDPNTLIIGIMPSLIIPALLQDSPNAKAVRFSGTFATLLASDPQIAQALGSISDPNQYVLALESMTPDTSGLLTTSINLHHLLFETVINRITSLREVTYTNSKSMQGLAAGDTQSVGGVGMWLQGYGSTADQNERGGVLGYEAGSSGVALGADALLTRNLRLGVVMSYANADIDTDMLTRNMDIHSYQGAFYGSYQSGMWFIDGAATYAYNDYESNRAVLGAKAKGDFSGDQWGGRLRLGKRINYQGAEYIPFLDFNYIHLATEGYTETGGGNFNLTVSSEEYNFFQTALGVSISKLYTLGEDMTYRPEVHAALLHEFTDEKLSNTAVFAPGGVGFTTVGLDPADTGLNLGGSLAIYSGDNLDVRAAYDYEKRAEYDSHAGQLVVRYLFY